MASIRAGKSLGSNVCFETKLATACPVGAVTGAFSILASSSDSLRVLRNPTQRVLVSDHPELGALRQRDTTRAKAATACEHSTLAQIWELHLVSAGVASSAGATFGIQRDLAGAGGTANNDVAPMLGPKQYRLLVAEGATALASVLLRLRDRSFE
jgi:hypothetical protein